MAVAASFKARGILKRLASTPLSPAKFIGVQAITNVGLGVAASTLVLAVGGLVGGRVMVSVNLAWFVPLVALIALTSIALAYLIAGLAPNPQTATNIGGAISFLMFGFGGVMFPTAALPGYLPDIVPYVIPHAAIIEVIRGIVSNGDAISEYGEQVLIGVGWLAVTLTIAPLVYRFTEGR